MKIGQPVRNKMGIITVLALACCALLQSMCSLALRQEGRQITEKASVSKGADVVVTLSEGFRKGELVAVGAGGLTLAMESGIDGPWSQAHPENRVTLPLSDIQSVRIIRKMRTANAGLFGAMLGIPIGVVAAKVSGVEADDLEGAIGKGSLFLLGGMLVGVAASILLSDPLAKDETYVLRGKSGEEIEKILAQIKKRARVENYQ